MAEIGPGLRVYTNPELRRIPGRDAAYLYSEPERHVELTPDTFYLLSQLRTPRPLGEVLPEPTDEQRQALGLLFDLRVLLVEGEAPRRGPARWRPAILRFLNAPHWTAGCAGPDAFVVLGARFDQNTLSLYPRGSADGPDQIRAATKLLANAMDLATGRPLGYYDPEGDRAILSGVRVFDAGDVEPHFTSATWTDFTGELKRALRAFRADGARVVLLGGDHSVTFPAVESLEEPAVGIIHFDAHSDLAAILGAQDLHHGNVMRHVAALPQVRQIVQLGCRGIQLEKPNVDGVDYRSWSVSRLRTVGSAAVAAELRPELAYYVSIDIDVLDPSLAPGTPAPVPEGLSLTEARALLRALLPPLRVVGLDLMEVLPAHDRPAITGHSAVQLLLEAMAAMSDG